MMLSHNSNNTQPSCLNKMSAPTIKIHGMGLSLAAQRVMIAAAENNAPFELITVDLRKGENKKPEYLAHQPFGVIPFIQDGDFEMYECRACARYVNESRGNALVPQDIKKRALMEQWISLEQALYTPELGTIVHQRMFYPLRGLTPNEEQLAKCIEKVTPGLDIMEKHLEKNQYLAGEQYTLADVFFQPTIAPLLRLEEGSLITSRPNIAAWFKRCVERKSWAHVMSFHELAGKKA